MKLWHEGDLHTLLKEAKQIQKKLASAKTKRKTDDVARIFSKLMMEGKIKSAMKFLEIQESAGLMAIDENTLRALKDRHPVGADAEEGSL